MASGAARDPGEPRPALGAAGTLSYTSLCELERCGYRYYLERVLGMPEQRAAAAGARHGHGLAGAGRGACSCTG